MPVKKSSYRKPVTPEGLKKMENGTLDYFDDDTWANMNTATMEMYFEEKNRVESFTRSNFDWKKVSIGIIMGVFFAVINQYVGLKIGIIISGGWYLAYLIGLALKWKPTEINIAAGACSGAFGTAAGFVFSFPAIYLLAYSDNYVMAEGARTITPAFLDSFPLVGIAISASLFSGLLGVLYFIIFRRIWIVADPLPYPGFESSIKLMDIANDMSSGSEERAKKAIKLVTKWGIFAGLLTFVRDFPLWRQTPDYVYYEAHFSSVLGAGHASLLDRIMQKATFYDKGSIIQPYSLDKTTRTHVGFGILPMQFAIGWFMQFRSAMLLTLGTLFSWFVIIPLAVSYNVPVYNVADGLYYSLLSAKFWVPEAGVTPAIVAYSRVARIVAIGAILGGGITALVKMAPVFKTAMSDVVALKSGGEGAAKPAFIEGRGWFEWPTQHIPIVAIVTLVGIAIILMAGGINPLFAFVFGITLIFVCFFLSAIAVKIAGEVRTTPVSGTSFIVLLILVGVFRLLGADTTIAAVLGLIGSTVFGTAVSLSSDISADFKIGQYCGTRPYHLIKGEITGLIFGVIAAGVAASILSMGLAKGTLTLEAPQANAFAIFTQMMVGGKTEYHLLILGFFVGVLAELTTGMGTAFGLGMYLPLKYTMPILAGGTMRSWWQKNKLEPEAKAKKWSERQKTFKLLETYMIAAGLIIGEALMGTVIAFMLIGMG
jgi:uncharacterized oligopeptide transporter (OPT) family protein